MDEQLLGSPGGERCRKPRCPHGSLRSHHHNHLEKLPCKSSRNPAAHCQLLGTTAEGLPAWLKRPRRKGLRSLGSYFKMDVWKKRSLPGNVHTTEQRQLGHPTGGRREQQVLRTETSRRYRSSAHSSHKTTGTNLSLAGFRSPLRSIDVERFKHVKLTWTL